MAPAVIFALILIAVGMRAWIAPGNDAPRGQWMAVG
jgi:hypothetical protein